MRLRKRLAALLAVTVVTAVGAAGCSATTSPTRPAAATSIGAATTSSGAVQRYASPNPGSVNVFWFTAPDGLVLVDSGRTLADAKLALAHLRQGGKPVVAILLTHSHPDHVGGLGIFHQAYPKAPIYASTATDKLMRTDPRGFYQLTRDTPNSDYPVHLTYADHLFAPNATLEVAGTSLQTVEYAEGESDSGTVYFEPSTKRLFPGDQFGDKVTVALIEGHSCGWLANLDRLRQQFPTADESYPGHGAPGQTAALITAQRDYLIFVRAQVATAVAEASPAGSTVTSEEVKTVAAAIDRRYPNYPVVASLPTLVQVNIQSVAAELRKAPTCSS
jgi:glyoxylase-like metal-dependent hydrolase (beta-lactamase superfamily II)